jgi:hypothetical protein
MVECRSVEAEEGHLTSKESFFHYQKLRCKNETGNGGRGEHLPIKWFPKRKRCPRELGRFLFSSINLLFIYNYTESI